MNKISVIIIAKNEEELIEDCLRSVAWADEIVFVDSGSTDSTIEIAKKYTEKIFIKSWEGFAKQKRYALSLASNQFVLSLDADERVSEKLKVEIENVDFSEIDGFMIPRENYFFKKHITTCGWNKDVQLRLFKKDKTTVTERLVHEGFEVEGKKSTLANPILHFTFNSIEKTISKINNYSTLQALEKYEAKDEVKSITIVSHGISAFIRTYISLKGYRDGIQGLMISIIDSMTTVLTYMKFWEFQNKK